jgi:hypothetical protein
MGLYLGQNVNGGLFQTDQLAILNLDTNSHHIFPPQTSIAIPDFEPINACTIQSEDLILLAESAFQPMTQAANFLPLTVLDLTYTIKNSDIYQQK